MTCSRAIPAAIGAKFSVRADLFRIVAGFTARDAFALTVCPALAGVRIEPSAVGGVMLTASTGLASIVVRDHGGRASRGISVRPPSPTLAIVRDATREAGVAGASAAPRLVFDGGHCCFDTAPHQELTIEEIGDPFPPWRARLPLRAKPDAIALPAGVTERIAIAARQLAQAAGQDVERAPFARFETLADQAGSGLIVVRFPDWFDAFALIAPDGFEAAAPKAKPPWTVPLWLVSGAANDATRGEAAGERA